MWLERPEQHVGIADGKERVACRRVGTVRDADDGGRDERVLGFERELHRGGLVVGAMRAEGKALEKVVVTGRRGPDWAEVISGISAGEQIIVNPGGLRTGQPVSITTVDASVVPAALATERATN